MVVVPESGGILLKRIGADAGLAGDEPVIGVAIVFGGGLGSVEVGGGADVGDVVAASVERVVDGQEVLSGEIVDPTDLDGLTGACFDDRSEGIGSVAPPAGGRNITVHLCADLLHGDGEGAAAVLEGGTDRFRNGEGIDEGRQLKGVEHWRADTRRVGLLVGVVHAGHAHGFLGQGALSGVEQADGGGLVQKGTSG